jgi:hypothetical protein
LVVPGGVDGEFADQFSGGGVDDPDVEVLNEHQNVGSCVGSADADVVQAAGQAQGEAAGVIDAVAAYAFVGVGAFAGLGFGPGGVCGGRGLAEKLANALGAIERMGGGARLGVPSRIWWGWHSERETRMPLWFLADDPRSTAALTGLTDVQRAG